MAEKLKVTRKRDSFYDEKGKLVQKFPSISQAKRHSRLMQGAGRWEVSVDRSADYPHLKNRPRGKRQDAADKFLTEALRKEQADRIAQEKARKAKQEFGPRTLSLSRPVKRERA